MGLEGEVIGVVLMEKIEVMERVEKDLINELKILR